MPSLSTPAYSQLEGVLNRARAIINDSEVPGGDILTDAYAQLFPLANIAYETIQRKLAVSGVEVFTDYAWLLNLPAVPVLDPEARIIVTDTNTILYYPNNSGMVFPTPTLPSDLITPTKCWERQNGSSTFATVMMRPNDGLRDTMQTNWLLQWEWGTFNTFAAILLSGATQAQDLKVKYERHLPPFGSVNDQVPIRGVDNAAAYEIAKVFVAARSGGGPIAQSFAQEGDAEIEALIQLSARQAQRKRNRRQPYSGRSRRNYPIL